MKTLYKEPRIYTGGVDIRQWSKLKVSEQKAALDKDWYVYYSFLDPETLKLKRQPNIKAGANRFKCKKKRYEFLCVMKRNLELLLESGFNPHEYKKSLEDNFLDQNEMSEFKIRASQNQISKGQTTSKLEGKPQNKPVITTIKEAVDIGMQTKQVLLADTSYGKFKSRINRFLKWVRGQDIKESEDIAIITKKLVIQYLNDVLQNTSARNRNNARADLSSLFQVFEDNDLIKENFVKKINVLKTKSKRNKTYTPDEEDKIFEYMAKNDPTLLLFVKFMAFGHLRPLEVCRLKVKDLDVKEGRLRFQAKNKTVKLKIIPEILKTDIPNLEDKNGDDSLFTPYGIGFQWGVKVESKRDFFTKRFKKVKDHLGLGIEYGLYSIRHTFITKLYRGFAREMTPNEAKSKLMLITGHTTMTALEAYLRDIDAVLPEDFSEYLKK